jgi:hypothetical protein
MNFRAGLLAPMLAFCVTSPLAQAGAFSELRKLASGLGPWRGPGEKPGANDGFEALKRSVADASEKRGLFEVTRKTEDGKERRFLVVRNDQLEKFFLFSGTLEQGTGKNDEFTGEYFKSFVCSFRQAGGRLQFLRRPMGIRAAAGSPEEAAIKTSISDDIVTTVPILSIQSPEGYLVVSADDLFLQDLARADFMLQKKYFDKRLLFSDQESSLESLQAHPNNLEARVQRVFNLYDNQVSDQLPEAKVAIKIHYSLCALPDDPGFEPRPADGRVGHFRTDFQDIGRPDLKELENPSVHLIARWNLQKSDPQAPVSDVKKPVVFWLDETIPEAYRPAIRSGILAWNSAFEAVGLRNAIVVKDVDKDLTPKERASFDPADISYNMVRWFVGDGASFAQAPIRVNPFTGEIFNASVRVADLMIRTYFSDLPLNPPKPGSSAAVNENDVDHARRKAALGLALAESGGPLSPAERERFINENLSALITHEIGHTLGLRHNFKGSAMLGRDDLGKDGLLSSSVMDYLPVYLAPQGKPQGAYTQLKPGPYDNWAVEYAYKPLLKGPSAQRSALEAIASKADSDPRLAYGSDGDADQRTDPDVQRDDLGRDSLSFARSRIESAEALWRRLEKNTPENDEAKRQFAAGFSAYRAAVRALLPVFGGMRTSSGNGPESFVPVTAAEQRQALAFLEEKAFSAEPFRFPPQLISRLQDDRLEHDNRSEFPLAQAILQMQSDALRGIYSPERLERLSNRSLYENNPGGMFTVGELMDRVRRAVWKEVSAEKPEPIGLLRRNLQKEHLAVLAGTFENPEVPGDARDMARRDLQRISRDIRKALKSGLDPASRAHLDSQLQAAQAALAPHK